MIESHLFYVHRFFLIGWFLLSGGCGGRGVDERTKSGPLLGAALDFLGVANAGERMIETNCSRR
ncbi:hypothetical protein CPB86DRAFT_320450 [Serendipita vermifera]|nr:hypothetical protein CPB86DRAFT_320450 [Serendipita vermifera]